MLIYFKFKIIVYVNKFIFNVASLKVLLSEVCHDLVKLNVIQEAQYKNVARMLLSILKTHT